MYTLFYAFFLYLLFHDEKQNVIAFDFSFKFRCYSMVISVQT